MADLNFKFFQQKIKKPENNTSEKVPELVLRVYTLLNHLSQTGSVLTKALDNKQETSAEYKANYKEIISEINNARDLVRNLQEILIGLSASGEEAEKERLDL